MKARGKLNESQEQAKGKPMGNRTQEESRRQAKAKPTGNHMDTKKTPEERQTEKKEAKHNERQKKAGSREPKLGARTRNTAGSQAGSGAKSRATTL